jgi:hypothetical protein
MPDAKISDATPITGANVADGDLFRIVDVSVGSTGSKSITRQELIMAMKRNVVRSTSVLNNTTTSIIPLDNTKPQISEGAEALSVSITPISTTSIIRITSQIHFQHSATGTWLGTALFVNGGTDAVSATSNYLQTASGNAQVHLLYSFVAGATSAQTISLRFGGHQAGTSTIMGSAHYNGVMNNFLEAEEIHI